MSVSENMRVNEFYLIIPEFAEVLGVDPDSENAATAYALARVAEEGGAEVYDTAAEAAASGGRVQRVTVTMVEG